jgi:predicted transcriptional regulator
MVNLTKAEERIMQILWDLGKGFIKDIQEQFPEPHPPYNTLSTIVRVLVKKKIVSYRSYGGSHQYYPLITREAYRSEQLGRLIKNYFDNSLKEVVHSFSEKNSLDMDEVEEALQLLEALKNKKSANKS